MKQALQTSTMQDFQYSILRGGGWHSYESRMTKSGEAVVLTIVRNITEQKQAEAALKKGARGRREKTHQIPGGHR